MIRVEAERSQLQNKELALELLRSKLKAASYNQKKNKLDSDRKEQIGFGLRGNKIRTISTQINQVIDHNTNKRMTVDRYLKGFLEELHNGTCTQTQSKNSQGTHPNGC